MTSVSTTVNVEIDASDFVHKWMDDADVVNLAKLLHDAGKGQQTIEYLAGHEGGITVRDITEAIDLMLDDYARGLGIHGHLARLGRDVCNRVVI